MFLQVRRCLASKLDSQWRRVADKSGLGGWGVTATKSLKSHQDLAPVSHLELLNGFRQVTAACAGGAVRFGLWKWPPSWDHLMLLI